VANPGRIITALWTDDDLGSSLRLDGVVAMIDSLNLESCLNSPDIANDVKLQIAYADRILLNKIHSVTNQKVRTLPNIFLQIKTFALTSPLPVFARLITSKESFKVLTLSQKSNILLMVKLQ